MCVHHRSVGPYHGRVVLARSAGKSRAGSKTGTTVANVAIVEVDIRHWHSGDAKCPHLPNQKEPPCSRCRVPVKFVVQISGEPKFVKDDEFLMGYRAFGGEEAAITALNSDRFRTLKLGKVSNYSCASLDNPAQSGASAMSDSPRRRTRPLAAGASSTVRDLPDDDDGDLPGLGGGGGGSQYAGNDGDEAATTAMSMPPQRALTLTRAALTMVVVRSLPLQPRPRPVQPLPPC